MITSPEKFYTEKVQPLEGKYRKLETLVGVAENDLEKAKKCSKKWEECLKKREDTKKQVEKERNNTFIPCHTQKKVKELDACVKCCRKTKACVLLKKQDVVLYEGRKKLVEQRLTLVKDDLKKAKDFWENLKKIYKNNESLSSQLSDNLLPAKAKRLLRYINCEEYEKNDTKKNKYSEEELKAKANALMFGENKTRVFDNEKEGITFIQATRRIHDDFSIFEQKLMGDEDDNVNFVQQAIKRCELLREYDRKGTKLLNVLKRKISSNSVLEESKFDFDVKMQKYEKAVSDAQGNYKKAMKLFEQIVNSSELNCSQKKCISIKNDSCNRKCALAAEKYCHEKWKCKNDSIICSQICCVEKKKHCTDPCPESLPAGSEREILQEATTECTPTEDTKKKYRKAMYYLDTWEASIPAHIWENLIRYEEARYLLSQVASIQHVVKNGYVSAVEDGTSEKPCMRMSKEKAMETALEKWICTFPAPNKLDHCDHFIQHARDLLDQQVTYAQKNSTERIRVAIQGGANTFIGQDLYKIIHEMKRKYSVEEPDDSGDDSCEASDSSKADSVTDPWSDLYGMCECPSIDKSMNVPPCDSGDPCTGDPPCVPICCKEVDDCKKENNLCDDNRTYPCIKNPECLDTSLFVMDGEPQPSSKPTHPPCEMEEEDDLQKQSQMNKEKPCSW